MEVDPQRWETTGMMNRPWRAALVNLSRSYEVEWLKLKSIEEAGSDDFTVSRMGTIAAGMVKIPSEKPIVLISMYGSWESSHPSGGRQIIYADGSVHRLISDISTLIRNEKDHRIIASGDLNILYGYGERSNTYWANRYSTVFERFRALGLHFVGPQAPEGGRQADPWPEELPETSRNVPTFHSNQQTPETAKRQMDFVFASKSLIDRVKVRARNEPEEWGPSDHCRIEIELL